jgi:hypothetical protein
MGDPFTAVAMLLSAAGSAASAAKQQSNARKIARKNRAAQDKQLREQRLLDAQTQQMQKRTEADETQYDIGALQVGDRNTKGKRTVRDAPAVPAATGLRVG